MKKKWLLAGFFFGLIYTGSLMALAADMSVSLKWGKRFQDNFDRLWGQMRYRNQNLTDVVTTSELAYVRNLAEMEISLLLSPVYGHYFGLTLGYQPPSEKARFKGSTNGVNFLWEMEVEQMAPGISYRFYPLAGNQKWKYVYLGADAMISFARARLSLAYQSSTTSGSEVVYFNRLVGARAILRAGRKFEISPRLFWYIEGGLAISRLDDFEGSATDPAIGALQLKNSSDYMVAIPLANQTAYPGFGNTSLWMNQFFLAAGISLRFGQ